MQKLMKRALCVLVCALLLAGLALPAFAGGGFDPEANCTLTIQFHDGATPVSGASFSVYRVATVDRSVIFTKTAQFAASSVELNGVENNEQWLAAAKTLADYVSVKRLSRDASAVTDRNGEAVLSELPAGLYLIVGAPTEQNRTLYQPTPVLICLPNRVNDEWTTDVTSVVKFRSQYIPPVPPTPVDDTTTHKALKVWDDNDNFAERPASITVYLLRDGEVYDTVTLTEENNWRYTWDDLPLYSRKGFVSDWTVSEEPVNGFTTLVSDEGITTVITNSSEKPEPEEIVEEPEPELPNTGLLWWPVPVLLLAGLAFVIGGLLLNKKQKA